MCVRGGRRESVRKIKIGRGGKERRERNGRERAETDYFRVFEMLVTISPINNCS